MSLRGGIPNEAEAIQNLRLLRALRALAMTHAAVFLMGLVVGSFLNVLIHRLPKDESILRPHRSYCPRCGHDIAWYDNIPVLSFILLGGKCRHCRERISWRYLFVELASGGLWLGSWIGSGGSSVFWVSVVFTSLLLVGLVTDFETGLIPDEITLGGSLVGLGASFFLPELHQTSLSTAAVGKSLLGLLVGGGIIYLTGLAGNWIFQRELMKRGLEQSMGGGDVKLLAMVGAFLGWEKVLLVFFTAPFLGLPFALYQRFAKKEAVIPYGPFLSIAAGVYFFYGQSVWNYFIARM